MKEKFSEGKMKQTYKRDLTIDLIKGIGIVLMVMVHADAPFSHFISLFHMPIFFIASGYLFKSSQIKSFSDLRKYFVRKIKGLWLPYFCFSVVFIVLQNLFLRLGIYSNSYTSKELSITRYDYLGIKDIIQGIFKSAVFKASTELGGPLWFLGALFIVLVLYATIRFVLKQVCKERTEDILVGLFALLCLLIGYYCFLKEFSFWGLARVFSSFSLIFIGEMLHKYNIMQLLYGKEKSIIRTVPIIAIVFLVLCIENTRGTIVLAYNTIENPVYFLIVSIAGWIGLFGIAILLQKVCFLGNQFIAYISIHSVAILALHTLCFKIINLLGVIVTGQEWYKIAAFPVSMSNGVWWLLYTIVGIAIPLFANKFFWKVFNVQKSKYKTH